MKTGKSYWAFKVANSDVCSQVPNKEYQILRRKVRSEVAAVLGNDDPNFSTKELAEAAKNKLPEDTQKWVEVAQFWPVSLGLGWC